MASGKQHRTYDSFGENNADEGIAGILEYVSGGRAVRGDSGGGINVLEEDISVSF